VNEKGCRLSGAAKCAGTHVGRAGVKPAGGGDYLRNIEAGARRNKAS
jgi:hypothetical protein